jgi:hypothetical protein
MKKFSIVLSTILMLSLFTYPVFATEDTTVSDVLGSTNETTANTTSTQQTTTVDSNGLKLEIPSQTDNPSTIITFVNPSKDNAIVQLEIDSKGFVDITSPYTFPALSIGKHTLEFKYQDENGSTQAYETSIIVIPRAPIFNTPVIGTEKVTISGTGLANSEIIVLLSSGSAVFTKTTTIDENGKWSLDFLNKDLTKEVYSLNAYTRRYGYASNLSETTKFTLDSQNPASNNSVTSFNIKDITLDSVENWVITNQNYLITAFASLIVGIMLGISFVTKRKQNSEKRVEKKVAEKFVSSNSKEKGVTLREKLMGAEKTTGVQESKAEEVVDNKEKPEENEDKVVNKIDFLKDFKDFDPDNVKGEEKQSSVKVDLTSKK